MELSECRVGQKVYVVDGGHEWFSSRGSKEELEKARTTHILGISGSMAIVFKPKELGGYGMWMETKAVQDGWLMLPEYLQPIHEPPKVKPYPHQCKVCKAPARNVGKLTLCSRDRCKSRAAVKKTYKSVVVRVRKVAGVDTDGYPLCPECGARVNSINDNSSKPDLTNVCSVGHEWKHTWIAGQRLVSGVGYYEYGHDDWFKHMTD